MEPDENWYRYPFVGGIVCAFRAVKKNPSTNRDWLPSVGPEIVSAPAFAMPDHFGHDRPRNAGRPKGTVIPVSSAPPFDPSAKRISCICKRKEEIESQGLKLAAISYDSPSILKDFAERHRIDFTRLADPRSEIIAASRYLTRSEGIPKHGVP